ncbi:MBL fold metallo-hydrolase [Glycomyces xiaoerkulensis]|uniref:MBL fold metallo-hydrolase n=1 Tax=Glycomyces xiaoerkulensis TaxID=2038139 RepID=UPI001E5210CB|nr:MBL fold metallo-hydrolase [Glycomyces xiaoerkulensis]
MPACVIALADAEGPFFSERGDAFPTATPEQWRAADTFDPGAVTDRGRWWLQFRAFAIRTGERVILVDAGIGPADSPAAAWAPVPGRLPERLAAAGIDRGEVDTVVLTHLHTDHVGWAVVSDEDSLRPYFPDARYVLQRTELEAIEELNPSLRESLIEPLQAEDRLELTDGGRDLAAGVRAIHTPGHTPGHQSVLAETDSGTTAVTGDVLVHAIQLLHPELPYTQESDPEAARRTRIELLDSLARADGTLATPHLTGPFVPARI